MPIKTALLAVCAVALLTTLAAAQSCTVSDTLHRSDGTPGPVEVRVLRTQSLDGRLITTHVRLWRSDSATGVISMTLARNSHTWLYCQALPELNNPAGVRLTIPDASTAQLRALIPATELPSSVLVTVPGCSDVVLAQLRDSLNHVVRTERDPHYLADQSGIYSGIAGAQQTASVAAQAAQEAGQAANQAQNSANDAQHYAEGVHQEAVDAQATAESGVALATLAMDTALTRATPGELRATVRDSLERVVRAERDPIYMSERNELFLRTDTTRLHSGRMKLIEDLIAARRDSVTINGQKSTTFTLTDTSAANYWMRAFIELSDTTRLHSGRLKTIEDLIAARRDSVTINGQKSTAFTVPAIADSTMPYAFVGGAITLYRGTRNSILALTSIAPKWIASGTTVFGISAGNASTTGTNNTMIGNNAGSALTTGYENTFVGSRSGIRNKTGYGHTAVGDETLYSSWDGWNVTAVGSLAGYYHAHGAGAIYLGRNAGPAVQDTAVTFNYSIALGTNARPTRSNQMVIGGSGAGIDTTHVGNGVWNSTPTSVVIKSTNPLPNDGGSTPGGNITIMAGSAGPVRSGRVQLVTSAQVRLAIDSTGTLEGNSQMRGTTTIGSGDSVQVSVPGCAPTDVVMATYNIGKTALAAGDTILTCKIWSVGTLTIFGVANRKVSWIRFR